MDDAEDFLPIGAAAAAVGVPERTIRYWITTGKLAATGGKRSRRVRLADVRHVAAVAGRVAATSGPPAVVEPVPDHLAAMLAQGLIDLSDVIRTNTELAAEVAELRQELRQAIRQQEAALPQRDQAIVAEMRALLAARRRPWWRFWER